MDVDNLSGFTKILLADIVPAIGCVVSFVVFLAPLVTVLRGRRQGRLGEINPIPYPAQVGNCIAWIAYGVNTQDQYVVWANFPGLFLGGFYTLSAYALAFKEEKEERIKARAITPKSVDVIMAGRSIVPSPTTATLATAAPEESLASDSASGKSIAKEQNGNRGSLTAKQQIEPRGMVSVKRRLRSRLFLTELMLATVIFINAMCIYISGFFLSQSDAKLVLAVAANFMVAILYISPLATFVKVIKTKNAESIDPRWAVGQLFNCILWAIYGIVINSPAIYGVNLLGITTGVLQFVLLGLYGNYSCCGRRQKKNDEESRVDTPAEAGGDGDTNGVAALGAKAAALPTETSPRAENVVDLDGSMDEGEGAPLSV